MAAAPKKNRADMGGLVRFGQGVASLTMTLREGYDYRAPPDDVAELELPPACTLPTLAWNPADGAMCYDSLTHASNGVVANVKFDECTGAMVAVSHNWLSLSYFVFHHQHSQAAAVPATVLKCLQTFVNALSNPKVALAFPSTPSQPKRLLAFDPLRSRRLKAAPKDTAGECRSIHHRAIAPPLTKPVAAVSPAGKKTKRFGVSRSALRAAALKVPISTRVTQFLYEPKVMCAACSKINAMRLNTNICMWTIPDIGRRFGADHEYAAAWAALAKNMTVPVIAGLAVSNVTAAGVRRVIMRRTGSLARGTAVYAMLNHVRMHRGGSVKAIVCTVFADRMTTAAGVLACYASKQSTENVNGQLAKMLRDKATAHVLASTGRLKFPKLLPKRIMTAASNDGISQHWWWAAIGYQSGPKPTLTSRFVAVPNRHDDEGSYTFVSSEMWTVLDAVRSGWKLYLGLAPPFQAHDLRPRVGGNGKPPVHAAFESTNVTLPFPEVLCGEYASWWTLAREMENRKVAANSADPSTWAPLRLTGNWMAADAGVTLTVPGWAPALTFTHGYCFQTLCRLAVIFKFSNFKIDLSPYADYAAYSPGTRDAVQACAQEHLKLIGLVRAETAGGSAKAYEADGAASAERILQDVCSRK